jgi:ATP-dependent DNA helicase RecG
LTVAGALHLLPKPEEKLGRTYIEVLRYREEAENYDRRIQVGGPLRDQVERTTQLIADEVGSEVVVLGVHRHELPRLPQRVLREAIANAVAHRSYEMDGAAVRVEIRPDAVVITSPGPLPEPVTIENIRDQASARNTCVIRVLRAFHLAEELGLGVDVMQDTMRDELLDPPVFSDSGSAVSVRLPVRSAVAPSERAWVREVQQRGLIESSDRILLVHAARGEVLTNSRARKLLRVDKDQARSALQRLRDAGFLVQRGERGGATYVLDRSLEPPAGLRLGRVELEDLVIEMAREKPLANADVRERTGLDRMQTLELLGKLVQEGRLERNGIRRGTRYRALLEG